MNRVKGRPEMSSLPSSSASVPSSQSERVVSDAAKSMVTGGWTNCSSWLADRCWLSWIAAARRSRMRRVTSCPRRTLSSRPDRVRNARPATMMMRATTTTSSVRLKPASAPRAWRRFRPAKAAPRPVTGQRFSVALFREAFINLHLQRQSSSRCVCVRGVSRRFIEIRAGGVRRRACGFPPASKSRDAATFKAAPPSEAPVVPFHLPAKISHLRRPAGRA